MIKILPFTGQIAGLGMELWPPNKSNDVQGMAREAEAEMQHIRGLGFPDTTVTIIDCAAPYRGLMEFNEIWLFADTINAEPAVVRGMLAHEYGHFAHNIVRRAGLEADYWKARGLTKDPAPAGEIFADDWKRLFGSEIATSIPFSDYGYGQLGYEYGEPIQQLQGWPQRRQEMREIVMAAVKQQYPELGPPEPDPQPEPEPEAPEPTKPGASPFADVSGHWAEADIVAAEKAGVLKGDPDGKFRPDGLVTRAELAVVINRLLGRA